MVRSIRFKMGVALVLLLLLACLLAGAGLYAVSLYRNLVRDVAWRADVLPVASQLSGSVGELRSVVGELKGIRRFRFRLAPLESSEDLFGLPGRFRKRLFEIRQTYKEYQQLLEERRTDLGDSVSFRHEVETLQEIQKAVQRLDNTISQKEWSSTEETLESAETNLQTLQQLVDKLPNYLNAELKGYSQTAKHQARWLKAAVYVCVLTSTVLLALLIHLSYIWIFRPLSVLIAGSRLIGDGTFQHRIQLQTHDEMAELAEALNRMTENFEAIRDDLDTQVQLRSREVIQNERLASVGFLAAGVAHEINNPLTAIATCAESLQRRVDSVGDDAVLAKRYLQMIQDEAFRCKEITEKLLSFARTENRQRERTNLTPLIADITEMTRQHGEFKAKRLTLDLPESLWLHVNPQEMKQVFLNLLTNAMNSTEKDGAIRIQLRQEGKNAVLSVSDDGCGMDESVLKNVFEPFFTRRKHGVGTGLGLSITHRIVSEHHGRIEASSDGPGRGSTFRVELPIE